MNQFFYKVKLRSNWFAWSFISFIKEATYNYIALLPLITFVIFVSLCAIYFAAKTISTNQLLYDLLINLSASSFFSLIALLFIDIYIKLIDFKRRIRVKNMILQNLNGLVYKSVRTFESALKKDSYSSFIWPPKNEYLTVRNNYKNNIKSTIEKGKILKKDYFSIRNELLEIKSSAEKILYHYHSELPRNVFESLYSFTNTINLLENSLSLINIRMTIKEIVKNSKLKKEEVKHLYGNDKTFAESQMRSDLLIFLNSLEELSNSVYKNINNPDRALNLK